MGLQVTAIEAAIIALAESCREDAPKNVMGDPAHAVEPLGDPATPDKVTTGGGQLVFDVNSILGSSDASGSSIRVRLVATPASYQDVTTTWVAGQGDPDNKYGTGKNQATTGLLGQTPPGSSVAADYELLEMAGHGTAWEMDGGSPPKPKTPIRVQVEGFANYVEETLVGKLNELIDQYNQLRTDYNDSTVPTSAAEVTKLPVV